jgi:thymidylate synthase (FAD)
MTLQIFYEPKITLLAVPKFTEPGHLPIEWVGEATDGERLSEFAGRLCYMSQANPAKRTTPEYLANIRKQQHGSVFEHANYSLLLEQVSRSFTHELVRHRAGFAYSQLSQRYVDESDTAVVMPPAFIAMKGDVGVSTRAAWTATVEAAIIDYTKFSNTLFEQYAHVEDRTQRRKMAREAARSVLPNATETKIVTTANGRAWRTMLELRTGEGAEAEMRRCSVEILRMLQTVAPGFFDDFEIYTAADGVPAAHCGFHKV